MTMGLAMKMGRLAMNQQLTAGGFQGRVLTAAFAQDMWSKIDKDTRGELDRAAAKTYGKGVGFKDIDAYEASNLLANLESVSPGLYTRAMEGSFKRLMQIEKESGWGAAEQTAQAIGIPQWREFRKAWTAEEGAPPSYEKLQEIMMTADERMLEASKKMLTASETGLTAAELAKMNADLNQQWYSDLKAFWTYAMGQIVETLGGETLGDIAEGITVQTLGQAVAGGATLPMLWALKQTGLWQEATKGPAAVGGAAVPKGARLEPTEEGEEGVIETPEGTFRIIYTGPPPTGKPVGENIGGTPLR